MECNRYSWEAGGAVEYNDRSNQGVGETMDEYQGILWLRYGWRRKRQRV